MGNVAPRGRFNNQLDYIIIWLDYYLFFLDLRDPYKWLYKNGYHWGYYTPVSGVYLDVPFEVIGSKVIGSVDYNP